MTFQRLVQRHCTACGGSLNNPSDVAESRDKSMFVLRSDLLERDDSGPDLIHEGCI
jgi:hypothetical protein